MTEIALIVAVAKDKTIGRKNIMPWHCSEDLKHFKQTTLNNPVIMGRRTFDSIGKPLPKRHNIILSKQSDLHIDGCAVVQTMEQALTNAHAYNEQNNNNKIFIIGGAQIYILGMPYANTLYITEFNTIVNDGDAFFPDWHKNEWQLDTPDNEGEFLTSVNDGLLYRFCKYSKID